MQRFVEEAKSPSIVSPNTTARVYKISSPIEMSFLDYDTCSLLHDLKQWDVPFEISGYLMPTEQILFRKYLKGIIHFYRWLGNSRAMLSGGHTAARITFVHDVLDVRFFFSKNSSDCIWENIHHIAVVLGSMKCQRKWAASVCDVACSNTKIL